MKEKLDKAIDTIARQVQTIGELKKDKEELIEAVEMAIGGLTVLSIGTPVEDNELIKTLESTIKKHKS